MRFEGEVNKEDMSMSTPGLNPCDSSSQLADWENEGGASASVPESASRYAPDDIIRSFGECVVAHWNELPHGFKQLVFREIKSSCNEPGAGLKKRAARFLHDNSAQLLKREKLGAGMGRTPHAAGLQQESRVSMISIAKE